MNIRFRQVAPVILSIIGAAGVVLTSVLTAKETPKAAKKLEEVKKNPECKKIDVLKTVVPCYIPAIVSGTITIASIVSSTIISKKTEASLTATCMMLDQGWRKYKGQVKKVIGEKAHLDILDAQAKEDYVAQEVDKVEVPDDRELYWEEHVGYFLAKPIDLAFAYGDLNQRLQVEDYVGKTWFFAMLYNLLIDANAELLNKDIKPEELNIGWSADYLIEAYEYVWIHMSLVESEEEYNGRKVTKVIFFEDPIFDPGNYGEWFANHDESDDEHRFKTVEETKDIENEKEPIKVN